MPQSFWQERRWDSWPVLQQDWVSVGRQECAERRAKPGVAMLRTRVVLFLI